MRIHKTAKELFKACFVNRGNPNSRLLFYGKEKPGLKGNVFRVFWFDDVMNFGDSLNRSFLEKLSGKKVERVKIEYPGEALYMASGSILDRAKPNTIVWGSGFLTSSQVLVVPPLAILAVRGPKTRWILRKQGIQCPKIYGDPALLLPRVYSPEIKKTHKLGIIPHYVDKNNPWLGELNDMGRSDIKVIDIQNADIWKVVDDVLSCDLIASSSLHGLIAADAYGIPSAWLKFSEDLAGDGFKFHDYFESVHRKKVEPLFVEPGLHPSRIYDRFYDYKIDIDLDKLYAVCPFI